MHSRPAFDFASQGFSIFHSFGRGGCNFLVSGRFGGRLLQMLFIELVTTLICQTISLSLCYRPSLCIGGVNATAQYNVDWENTPTDGRARTDKILLLTLGYTW